MTAPPPYPRIPHLVPGRGSRDDRVLDAEQAAAMLARPVLVEEKLDGANVVLWLEGDRVECALRSGVDAQDRGKQLGPLRAWLAERTTALRELLDGFALYGEWLFTAHGVRYDALPAYLVGLDVWAPDLGFVTPEARNELLMNAGLTAPPTLYRGTLKRVDQVEALLGCSRLGSEPMEGVVVRTLDAGEPRIAKLLRPGFSPASNDEWRRGRPRNLLRKRELSWR